MALVVREICGLFVYFCILYKGISSFEAVPLVTPTLPVLGDNSFTLQCFFELGSNQEQLQGLSLDRKRTGDSDFVSILAFPPPSLMGGTVSVQDSSLAPRTVVTKPDASLSTSASVTFNNTVCSDIAVYKWRVVYYSEGYYIPMEIISDVKVKVAGTFVDFGYGITGISPGYVVVEGTNVTVTCKADVGAEPQGQLEWYYYIEGSGIANLVSDKAIKGDLQTVRECSHTQESTLSLTMNENLNGISIRCTLQQEIQTAEGDDHRQTNRFNVSFSPRQTTIAANPVQPVYSEGEPVLILTCSSRANPQPSYKWRLPDGTEAAGSTYQIQSLTICDRGNYTCIAKNGIPGDNYSDTTVFRVLVEKTTTTVSTGNGNPMHCSCEADSKDDNSVAVVAGCMGSVIAILTGALIILLLRQQKCFKTKGSPAYEIPDREHQRPDERTYDTLNPASDSYEVPEQTNAQRYANTAMDS